MIITKEEHLDLSVFSTLTGTMSEVRSRLTGSTAERAIVLTFAHENEGTVNAIAATMASIAPLVSAIMKRRQHDALAKIVDALVPNTPPPEHMLLEARMTAQARKAVLEAGEWLTAAQIAELAGFSTTNPSAQPNKWKKDGLVFAIRHQGSDYFPDYGLDPTANYRPLKALADVIRVFNGSKDAWGMAYWFAAVNSFLGGKRPLDMMSREPKRVIAAAYDEMAEIAHG
jgi:hypothetical protein